MHIYHQLQTYIALVLSPWFTEGSCSIWNNNSSSSWISIPPFPFAMLQPSRINAFKIPRMIYCNHRSLMISGNYAKYIEKVGRGVLLKNINTFYSRQLGILVLSKVRFTKDWLFAPKTHLTVIKRKIVCYFLYTHGDSVFVKTWFFLKCQKVKYKDCFLTYTSLY